MLTLISNFFKGKFPQLAKIIMEREKKYNPRDSRKYRLALLVLFLSFLLCGAPPMISTWVFHATPLIIISGAEFVTIISLLIASYFTANVVQKSGKKSEEKKEEPPVA